MEAQTVYIKVLRLTLKSASDVSKRRLQELTAGIGELRQLLSCVVCRQLLKDPYEPVRRRCGHHVCRLCLRGRKRLKPGCEQCQDCMDFKTYKENKSMAWQVLCYKTLCKQLQHSMLYAQLAGQLLSNCSLYNMLCETSSRIQLPDESTQWFICEGANYNDMCDTFLPQPDMLSFNIASLPAETPPTTAATTPELPFEQHLPEPQQQLSLTDIELEAAATGDQFIHQPLPLMATASGGARVLQIPAAPQPIMTAGFMEPSWTDQVDLSTAFTINPFGHSGGTTTTANYATYVLPSGCSELPLHMPAIGQVVQMPVEALTTTAASTSTAGFKRRHAELLAEEMEQQLEEQQQQEINQLPQKPTIISSIQVKPPSATPLVPVASVPKRMTTAVPKVVAKPATATRVLTATAAAPKASTATVTAAPKALSASVTPAPKALTATATAAAPKALTKTSLTATVSKASTAPTVTASKVLRTSGVVKPATASTTAAPKTLKTSPTATAPKSLKTPIASKATAITKNAVTPKPTATSQPTAGPKSQATPQAAAMPKSKATSQATTRSTATKVVDAPTATAAKVATSATPPKAIQSPTKQPKQKSKDALKRGCRCGTSSAPGKATCRTTRCACYMSGLKCVECKCNGCKNPHTYMGDSSDEDTESELEDELEQEEQEVPVAEAMPQPAASNQASVTLILVSNPHESKHPMVVMKNENGEDQYFNAFNGSEPIDPSGITLTGFEYVVMPPPPPPSSVVEQAPKKFKNMFGLEASAPAPEMSSHSRLESVDELLGASSKSKVVAGDSAQALFEDIMSGSDDL